MAGATGQTFVSKKLRSLIGANVMQLGLYFLSVLCGNIIAGNMLGEAALSATSLAAPFVTLVSFAGSMTALGASALISYEVGRQNTGQANRYFGQGLILSAAVGAILSAAYFLIFALRPNVFGVGEEMNRYFQDYFRFICLLPLIKLPGNYILTVALNEGGERASILASVLNVAGMVLLSVPGPQRRLPGPVFQLGFRLQQRNRRHGHRAGLGQDQHVQILFRFPFVPGKRRKHRLRHVPLA